MNSDLKKIHLKKLTDKDAQSLYDRLCGQIHIDMIREDGEE